jgi:hypothetical protein
LSDSFYDEDSKCPKCQGRIEQGWQTKRLESLMESWHKGDSVQYTKLETIPEDERRREYGDDTLAPFLRKTKTTPSRQSLSGPGYESTAL